VKKKVFFSLIVLTLLALVAVPLFSGCARAPTPPPEKDKIVFGAVRPLSGPLNFFEQFGMGPVYKLWVDQVNAKGGIYVREYDKQLPIEVLTYDDGSDMGKMTRLLERLILEDKVDFVFPPCSTAFLYAAAPIFNKHGYILFGGEGGATSITAQLPSLPYVFMPLNYSDHYQVPRLVEILADLGVKTAAIVFIGDLHGIEYSGVATPALAVAGIDVKMNKSVPPGTPDLSPLLKEAKALDVDAFLSFTYPPETPTITAQAIALGINFDVFLLGPGGSYTVVKEGIGGNEAMEGVMAWGAWNGKSSPAAAEFEATMIDRYGPIVTDYWGQITFMASLQFLEQAIVDAGTLDQAVIRDVMAKNTYETVMGPYFYDIQGGGGGLLAEEVYLGQVGQWQSGVFEVIDVGPLRTAPPIYPKPDWPAP